ncbi:hypothetical protein L9F63_014346, partial [Diploptera punctata]
VLATMGCNLVALDVIITLAFSTVAIAQMYNANGEISLDGAQASWIASIPYICQPCGSVMSGVIVQYLGRKRSLILVNIPFLIGWILVCTANSFPQLVTAQVVLGITIGLCEAPLNTYYGEISQPSIRGILAGTAGIAYQTGFFLEYLLGTVTYWRNVAYINAAFPIITALYFSQIPEAPIWLLSKGRTTDAEKSLCWLRGWVRPSAVKQEFFQLIRYNEEANKRAAQLHTPAKTFMSTLQELLRAPTLRPLSLVIPFFFFVHWSGLTSIRPYMVHVFQEFRIPLDPSWATVVAAGTAIAGSVVLIFLVHHAGKRFLSLCCTALSGIACVLLGLYAHFADPSAVSWLPLALFLMLAFSQSIVSQMPWTLLCEVFPYRTRGLASGITAAACYIFLFFSSKTFLDIENTFQLEGAFWLYGSISCLGFVFLYFRLLETEGTLEEIEAHFTEGRMSTSCKDLRRYISNKIKIRLYKTIIKYLGHATTNIDENNSGKSQHRTVSRFKEVLPQVLAMSAANMVVIVLTIALFFSTLVIAEVHNKEGPLSMDDTQASWFGSLPFFCQPVGSLASGFIVQWLGRKKALMLINIPYCIGIVMLSIAPSVSVLFVANILLGTTVGFTEAPINSYFGEICQPELRSILTGSAGIFYQTGMCVLYVLGSLLHWKTTAAVLAVVPVIAFILLTQVPESPIWLIAQGRMQDAEAALCWLRGWVEPSAVQHEFQQLIAYHESVTKKQSSRQDGEAGPEKDNLLAANDNTGKDLKDDDKQQVDLKTRVVNMVRLLLQRETRRPLVLIVLFFQFCGMGGMYSIRPFLIEVLREFQVPLDANWSTVVMTVTGFLGSIVLILIINRAGKRKVALVTTAVSGGCCLLLGFYAYLSIVPAARTGDLSYIRATWIPLVLFSLFSFANTMEGQVPWLLVAEAFPYRTRGIAGGLAAASNYIIAFVATKTYLATAHSFQLFGTFWFYGAISIICFLYLYLELPETEGKTLQEIETLFAAKKSRNVSGIYRTILHTETFRLSCVVKMDEKPVRTVSRFREVLPQVLAMTAANLVVLNMAVTFFFSTLVIADLHNSHQELSMNDAQASWFGGLPYMCQPIGSICQLLPVLFFSNVLIGITVGFTEAPINSYFGDEVCQPELRSVLAGSAALFYQFGMFLEFLLGSVIALENSRGCVYCRASCVLLPHQPDTRVPDMAGSTRKKEGCADLSVLVERLGRTQGCAEGIGRLSVLLRKLLGEATTRRKTACSQNYLLCWKSRQRRKNTRFSGN